MPELDGPSLYATLERTAPDLLKRTCFISGDTLSPSARVFLQRVQRPFIEKPFTLEEVRALVGRVLNETRQPGVARRARGKEDCEGRNHGHAVSEAHCRRRRRGGHPRDDPGVPGTTRHPGHGDRKSTRQNYSH